MSTVPKDKTRSQQAKPDTKGTPTFNWQMSNTTLGDTVKLVIPPMHILPIIFVPGIMGSNLKDTKGNKVWRLDSTMGQPIGLAWMWAKKNAGQRQKLLHPSRTSVDSNGAVPKTPVGSIQDKSEFKTRGWGEVGQTSYHEFLLWLETTMNDRSYNPAEWNDFFYTSVSATPQPGAPRQVPKLYPGITMTMSGLPFYSEEQEMTAPVLSDDLLLRARCRFPVYACGYNWLDTNLNAANQLKERISSVIAQNNRGYFRCEQVILVTHSMGGLVARACSELAGAQGKIAGIVHGVMPAVGAAVAYRRCKIGMKDEDFGASLVIGSDGKEVTAVFSQAPGALQLLPSQDYNPKWLDIKGPDGKIIESLPASDPYAEIYLRKDQWWGLVREEWLSPDNGEPISWGEFSQNIGKAKAFHQSLSGKYHPNTFVFYGAGDKKQASFEKIQWTMKKGMQPETGKAPKPETIKDFSHGQVREDGTNLIYVGGETKIYNIPSMDPFGYTAPQVYETSFWEIVCAKQDGTGDGTVPSSSGKSPKKSGGAHVRQQFSLTGFSHEPAYKDPTAQRVTHYAITKILSKAKLS